MVDTDKLRGIIAANGHSQRKVAKILGLSEKTFYAKMKKRVFSSTEIEAMIHLLKIKDPMNLFFTIDVARQGTSPLVRSRQPPA